MCDYCGDMDRKHAKQPLGEGVVGRQLVSWFKAQKHSLPIWAEMLERNGTENTVNYRITFEDETVSDHKVSFEGHTTNVLDIEEFNRVI